MLVDRFFRSEFGDIELPDEGGGQAPGQSSVPILRRYSGEEAFASVLAQLLDEESLKVYWVTDRNAGRPDDPIYTDFARDLRGDGFELGLVDLDANPGAPVPEDCSLLVLLKPTAELGDQARRKVIDYFEAGGAVLLGLDFEVQEALQGLPQVTHRELLARYGLAVGTEMVLNGIPDSTQAGGVLYDNPACVRLLIRQGPQRSTRSRSPSQRTGGSSTWSGAPDHLPRAEAGGQLRRHPARDQRQVLDRGAGPDEVRSSSTLARATSALRRGRDRVPVRRAAPQPRAAGARVRGSPSSTPRTGSRGSTCAAGLRPGARGLARAPRSLVTVKSVDYRAGGSGPPRPSTACSGRCSLALPRRVPARGLRAGVLAEARMSSGP
ncbi:MAG: Gldg family protein [Planctomycetota bacterium]